MTLNSLESDLSQNRQAAVQIASIPSNSAEAITSAHGSWSAAQHLQHLALFNRAYFHAITSALDAHRQNALPQRGNLRVRLMSGLFLRSVEPPVRRWTRFRAPAAILPADLPLAAALDNFLESHDAIASFYTGNPDLDADRIFFVNPFVKGMDFSVSTCLLLVAAHERRHLWHITHPAA